MAKQDQTLLNLKKSLIIDASNQKLYGTSSDPTKSDFDKINDYAYKHKDSALSKEIEQAYQVTDDKKSQPTYLTYENIFKTGDFITPNLNLKGGTFQPLNKDDFVSTKADRNLAQKAYKSLKNDQKKTPQSEESKDSVKKSQAVNQNQESVSASATSQSSASVSASSNQEQSQSSSAQVSESAQSQSASSQASQSAKVSNSDVTQNSEAKQEASQAKDQSVKDSRATSQSAQDTTKKNPKVASQSQEESQSEPNKDQESTQQQESKPVDKKPQAKKLSRIDYLRNTSKYTKKLTNDVKTYLSDAQKYANDKPKYHMFKQKYTPNPNFNEEYKTVRQDSANLKANVNKANLSNKKLIADHSDTMVALMSEDYAKGMPLATSSVVHDVSKGELQVARDIKAEKQAKQQQANAKQKEQAEEKQSKARANTHQQRVASKPKMTRKDYLHNMTMATKALDHDATKAYNQGEIVSAADKYLIHKDLSSIESNANAGNLPNKDQVHEACKTVDQQAYNGNGKDVVRLSHQVTNYVSHGEISIVKGMQANTQKKKPQQEQQKEPQVVKDRASQQIKEQNQEKEQQIAESKQQMKNRQAIAKPNSSRNRKEYLHNVSVATTNLAQDSKQAQNAPQDKQLQQRIQLDLQGIDYNANAGNLSNKNQIHQECSYVEQRQGDPKLSQYSKAIYGDVTKGEVQVLKDVRAHKQYMAQQASNQTNQPNQSSRQMNVNKVTQAVDRASAESSRDQTQTQPKNQKPSKPTQKTYLHNVTMSTKQLAKDMHTFNYNMIMRDNDPKADVHNNISSKTIKSDVDYIKQNAIKGHMPNQDQVKQATSNLYANVLSNESGSVNDIPRNQKELKSVFDSVSKGEISIVQAKKRAIQGNLKPNLQHGMAQSGASLNSNPASKLNRKFHPNSNKKVDHQPKQESLFGTPDQSKEKQAKIKLNRQSHNIK